MTHTLTETILFAILFAMLLVYGARVAVDVWKALGEER